MPSKPTYVSDVEWEEHEQAYGKKGVIAYGIDSNDKAVSLLVNSDGSLVIDSKETTDLEGNGIVAVGTTAVEVAFTGTTQTIIISASTSNTGVLYVGKSDVASDGSNALVFLEAGENVELDFNDSTNAVYVVADTADQSFIAGCLK